MEKQIKMKKLNISVCEDTDRGERRISGFLLCNNLLNLNLEELDWLFLTLGLCPHRQKLKPPYFFLKLINVIFNNNLQVSNGYIHHSTKFYHAIG
jgi:hypothetical protein